MRRSTVPFLVFAALFGTFVFAQDAKPPAQPAQRTQAEKPVEKAGDAKAEDDDVPPRLKREKKVKPKIEDAVRRAYAKAKEDEELVLARFLVLKATDGDIDAPDAVVCVVEYTNGSLGFYLGGLDGTKDRYMIVDKKEITAFEEAAHRADRR